MSGLDKLGALSAIGTKKNFPDAGALLSKLTQSITTTYAASTLAYTQTDATGIKELTITPIGEALPGTTQATAAWRCQKIDTTTGTVITWADSGRFSQVATDLTALTYA